MKDKIILGICLPIVIIFPVSLVLLPDSFWTIRGMDVSLSLLFIGALFGVLQVITAIQYVRK